MCLHAISILILASLSILACPVKKFEVGYALHVHATHNTIYCTSRRWIGLPFWVVKDRLTYHLLMVLAQYYQSIPSLKSVDMRPDVHVIAGKEVVAPGDSNIPVPGCRSGCYNCGLEDRDLNIVNLPSIVCIFEVADNDTIRTTTTSPILPGKAIGRAG